jgi:hypothetical protein
MPRIPDTAAVCVALRQALYQLRNSDGGWGYFAGKRSRLEPTCWALLALAATDGGPVQTGRLRSWPRQEGWLIDVAGAPPNQPFNALAALTLLQDASAASLAQPIIANLLAAKGERYGQSEYSPENNSLQAWSWVKGTASWVEPTAWSVLLLKTLQRTGSLPREGAIRIQAGEQLLLDRVCAGGGWNYGNKRVFGHDLWAYVPTTALALLALQDRRHLSSVARSHRQMREDLRTERSSLALALALICLGVYDTWDLESADPDPVDDRRHGDAEYGRTELTRELTMLVTQDLEAPAQPVLSQAMALFALSDASATLKVFRL